MKELNKKIIDWAKERELDKKGTIEGQILKTIEEMSELIKGVCKNDKYLIEDSIGDVYVTLVIGNMLSGLNIENKVDFENELIIPMEDTGEIIGNLAGAINDMTFSIIPIIPYQALTLTIYTTLRRTASFYNTTLKECVQLAYDEIKMRKGKTINGTFVKEEDLK